MIERNEADRLLSAYWGGRPIPVDPKEIAEREGIVVRAQTSGELAGASGWYRQLESPTILFNSSEVNTRQRFTIAHELGHHVMKHGERPRDTSAAFMNPLDSAEVSANRFAAELLMPIHPMRVMVEERQVTSVTALAMAFNVSEPAMMYRLRNLGYIS